MTGRPRSTLALATCLGVASLIVGGCGGGDDSGDSGSAAASGGKTLTARRHRRCRLHRGLPARVAKQTYITLPTLPPDKHPPAGQKLIAELRKAKGGKEPDAYALYSYEAMNAILLAIENAGDNGDDREAVVDAFFAIKDRDSVLGTYSIDENGDTTLKSYGGFRIRNGQFAFDKVIGV